MLPVQPAALPVALPLGRPAEVLEEVLAEPPAELPAAATVAEPAEVLAEAPADLLAEAPAEPPAAATVRLPTALQRYQRARRQATQLLQVTAVALRVSLLASHRSEVPARQLLLLPDEVIALHLPEVLVALPE